jgi:hypothetical protein
MPVIVSRGEESVGYCALVYGKNNYGGYIGYRTFFAMLTPNAKGEYTGGTITYMGGRPTTLGNDTADDAVANGLIEGSCNRWGTQTLPKRREVSLSCPRALAAPEGPRISRANCPWP